MDMTVRFEYHGFWRGDLFGMKSFRGMVYWALLLVLPSSPACDTTSKPTGREFDAATPPSLKEDGATSILPDVAQVKDVAPEVSVVRTLADLEGSYTLIDFTVASVTVRSSPRRRTRCPSLVR